MNFGESRKGQRLSYRVGKRTDFPSSLSYKNDQLSNRRNIFRRDLSFEGTVYTYGDIIVDRLSQKQLFCCEAYGKQLILMSMYSNSVITKTE